MKLSRRELQVLAVIVAAVGFIVFPWIFAQSGINLSLSFISAFNFSSGGLFLVICLLAIAGMIARLKYPVLKWSSVVLVASAVLYYVVVTSSNSLFRFGNFSFLGLGYWITIVGGVIGIAEMIINKPKVVDPQQ